MVLLEGVPALHEPALYHAPAGQPGNRGVGDGGVGDGGAGGGVGVGGDGGGEGDGGGDGGGGGVGLGAESAAPETSPFLLLWCPLFVLKSHLVPSWNVQYLHCGSWVHMLQHSSAELA